MQKYYPIQNTLFWTGTQGTWFLFPVLSLTSCVPLSLCASVSAPTLYLSYSKLTGDTVYLHGPLTPRVSTVDKYLFITTNNNKMNNTGDM